MDTKQKIVSAITAFLILIVLNLNAFSQTVVPNEKRDMSGKTIVQNRTEFRVDGNTKVSRLCSWWDIEFFLTSNGQAGKAVVNIRDAAGNVETIAGFTSDGTTVIYTDWHAGAYVFNPENYYDVFQIGRVIKFSGSRSENLDVNLQMQPYSDFIWNHGCVSLELVSEGGLEIFPLSTVMMDKPMCTECEGSATCQTICFRDSFWWWKLGQNELNQYSVVQFGVNFGAEIAAGNREVYRNIRQNTDNGAAAVFQLQFQRQQVPPQNAGWAQCYGIRHDPFVVTDGDRVTKIEITDKTNLYEVNRLLKVAIKNSNYEDYRAILSVVRVMNDVHNCPQ